MTPLQQIGENLKRARRRCGMTQAQVAEDQGLKTSSMCQYERGQREPGATRLHGLACCFGVPMERFFEGIEW